MNSKGKLPLCSKCRSGYKQIDNAFDGRPQFKCTGCGLTWTQGYSGGTSLEKLKNNTQKDK